jgi:DNA polymerase-1
VSSDKDLMQLVCEGVSMLDTMKNKRIGDAEVLEKFGVEPCKVIHVQALAGDSVDNVPGIRGIGIKTAAELINQYGDLETLLARAGEIKQNKRRESIIEQAENARISLRLVTLDDHVPLREPPDGFAVHEPEPKELVGFLKAMEFTSIVKRVSAHFGIADPDAIAADMKVAPPREPGLLDPVDERPDIPGVQEDPALRAKIDHDAYATVTDEKALQDWIARAAAQGVVCVDTETTSLDPMQARLCGISLSVAPGQACYIPTGHRRGDGLNFDFSDQGGGNEAIAQLPETRVLAALKPLLEDDSVLKVGQNLKYDALIFLQRGIRLGPIDDTMLMSYAVEGGLHGHGMDELSELHLSHTPIAFSEVAGKGKDKITFDCVPVAQATKYSAEDADVTLRLWRIIKPKLLEQQKRRVYETLERPLVMVLADMERAGVMIDPTLLSKLSNDFALAQAALEAEIHKLAGQDFNIGSPKQLGEILFDKMGMEGGRKTKTGAWSTDSDVLEDVAAQGAPIAKKVLEWRGLAKLRGTYTDALPGYINPETGRVHTSYAMASTSTGRLASTDPNLQNIPVRTEEGRRIRQAFIAPKGSKLISADYSQIELRLLAHIADIPELKKAFAAGLDIHAMTASEIFGVPVKDMPAEVRRRAKAINFGIVYGISGFGLANQLGIAQAEANDYIKKYFTRFPGIRDYMEETKQFARTHGYVETLFGRRIHIREINSKVAGFRGGAERAAINAPIQGTAADIIRRAMVRLPPLLPPSVKMLLQVHDELIFEAPEKDVAKASKLIVATMEKASLPAVEISVPLVVEARAAGNWDAAH